VFQVEIKYNIQKIEKLDYLYYNIAMINSGRIQKENFHYFTKAASKLTEGEIEAISELFSNNYGKYSIHHPDLSKREKQIQLKPSYYKRNFTSNDYTYVALAYYETTLVGHAFYIIEKTSKGNATWVLQLVVKKDFRRQQIAKKLLFSIWGFSNAWGLATTNPLTIKTLESATLRKVSLQQMKQNIALIQQLSDKINFISRDDITINETNSIVNSSYYVSHEDIPNFISNYGNNWIFGNLQEGFEWLAFTFRDQFLKPISKKDFDNFIEYSEQRLIDAYSRMDMQNQSWAKHTAAEINFIKQYMPNTKELQIVDIGCGTARHIAELFANGYKNVYGFDFSQNLILQALNSHPELENKVFTKDVRNLKLSKKADVILCLYDVIGSFPTSSENLKIIKAAKRNLKKGGLFICSVMNMELTESLCKYKFDIYNNPKELFKLKASQTMQQTGNIFNPDNFIIDTTSNLVYRKEMFKGDGFLDSEYIIRDKRYTKNEISDLLETSGFSIVDSRYVRAGKFEEALNATDKNAKEILIIARLN